MAAIRNPLTIIFEHITGRKDVVESDAWATLPNLATLLGIMCLLVLAGQTATEKLSQASSLVVASALFFDAIDGLLARWLNQASSWGKWLDEVRDYFSCFVFLSVFWENASVRHQAAFIVIAFLCEFAMLAAHALNRLFYGHEEPDPHALRKIRMWTYGICTLVILGGESWFGQDLPGYALPVTIYIAVIAFFFVFFNTGRRMP